MKKLLVIKHIGSEGPGTIGDFFRFEGWPIVEVNLYDGDRLPATLEGVSAVISMGGPMNVYEEAEYPFLKDENIFIKRVMDEEVPFLGFCLGAQLLVKALGAKVKKAPVKEVGWGRAILTAEGMHDHLFAGIPHEFSVFQWHGDTFDLPRGAKLIAEGISCKNQCFRYGRNAYGLQFHIEVTRDIIASWIRADGGAMVEDPEKILQEVDDLEPEMRKYASVLCKNLLKTLTLQNKK